MSMYSTDPVWRNIFSSLQKKADYMLEQYLTNEIQRSPEMAGKLEQLKSLKQTLDKAQEDFNAAFNQAPPEVQNFMSMVAQSSLQSNAGNWLGPAALGLGIAMSPAVSDALAPKRQPLPQEAQVLWDEESEPKPEPKQKPSYPEYRGSPAVGSPTREKEPAPKKEDRLTQMILQRNMEELDRAQRELGYKPPGYEKPPQDLLPPDEESGLISRTIDYEPGPEGA